MANKVDFSWTPNSVGLAWTVNGNNYPYTRQQDNIDRSAQVGSLDSRYGAFTTPNNTLITFTAAVTLDAGAQVAEYRWDFGDGSVGFGATVGHTYKVSTPETRTSLTVTDTNRQVISCSKVMNLRFANEIVVSGMNAVS